MELTRTSDNLVTRVALVRAMRGWSHATLAQKVGVDALTVLRWERGQESLTPAMCKRLGMAMRWKWHEFSLPALPYDEAVGSLTMFRRKASNVESFGL
jgi:ribosome-binding protein aMBF1 (putative translation factor)